MTGLLSKNFPEEGWRERERDERAREMRGTLCPWITVASINTQVTPNQRLLAGRKFTYIWMRTHCL